MSGNFTQRGAPAIADKWARAEMALLSGADLVIELHTVYACSSAEHFAFGAINAINALNIGGSLSFGAESVDVGLFDNISDIFAYEDNIFKAELSAQLGQGVSFAAARAKAAEEIYKKNNPEMVGSVDIAGFLKSPNNILAIEYIKALKRSGARVKPFFVKRAVNRHNDRKMSGAISSATAIRQRFYEEIKNASLDLDNGLFLDNPVFATDVIASLPRPSLDIFSRELRLGRCFIFEEDLFLPLLILLRRMTVSDIEKYPDVSVGLARRIAATAAESCNSYEQLIAGVATKRYPSARIRRIFTNIMLDIKKSDLSDMAFNRGCPYIKVIGFNDTGRELLSEIKKATAIPIITNYAKIKDIKDPLTQMFMAAENRATDIYSALYRQHGDRTGGREFTHGIIRI
jgi:predicted nucleotidyltransferase